MTSYICDECGYIYDPEDGDSSAEVEPGTTFASLPADWTCPDCGAARSEFSPLDGDNYEGDQYDEDEEEWEDDQEYEDDEEEDWEDDED